MADCDMFNCKMYKNACALKCGPNKKDPFRELFFTSYFISFIKRLDSSFSWKKNGAIEIRLEKNNSSAVV